MARMTDIDALLEKVVKIQASGGNPEKRVGEIIQAITNAPTVEVVRCKDCIWRGQDEVNRNFCRLGDFYCGETDYCSRGEKMDGDGNE